MKNENMNLWNSVRTIDPRYTKTGKVNGRQMTSFSLQSVLEMATDKFGMFGIGWGYEVEKERMDEGAIIVQASEYTAEDGKVVSTPEVKEITHTLLIKFWYKYNGEKVVCPVQAGHTPYLMRTKYGPSHDGEYYKKTLADAIKKSLSMLGFGADIFLGLHDDPHYMAMMAEENQLKAQAEIPERIEKFGKRVIQMCEMFNANSVPHSINAMATNYQTEINKECRSLGIDSTQYLNKLKQAYDARIEKLKNGDK